jgi:hypothetical protein
MNKLNIDIGRTALVQIDLQNFNVNRELAPHPAERVVGNCVLLAGEMRGLPTIRCSSPARRPRRRKRPTWRRKPRCRRATTW